MNGKFLLLLVLIYFTIADTSFSQTETKFNKPLSNGVKALNPLIKYIYTADASAIVENDRVYVFTSHDKNNAKDYTMDDVACISSADMRNWRFEGLVLDHLQTGWTSLIWAPNVVKRGNTFYMYYCTGYSCKFDIGVAWSSNITGPYTDLGKSLCHDTLAKFYTDPTVLIDDDGQAYIYYNADGTIRYAKLNPDMISLATAPAYLSNSTFPYFMEGATITKINRKYNLTWSEGAENKIYNLRQSVSDFPDRDFKNSSMFMQFPSSNNQSSIFTFRGHIYTTFHTNFRTHIGFRRDVGICNVKAFNANGTMPEVTDITTPVEQLGYVNPYIMQRANEISDCYNVGYDSISAVGDQYIKAMKEGAWVKVSGVDFGKISPKSIQISVATPFSGKSIEVRLDSINGKKLTTIRVKLTKSLQHFDKSFARVSSVTGVHDIFFYYSKGLNHKTYQFNKTK